MDEQTPNRKFLRALLAGFLLSIPIFCVWLLVFDRRDQSVEARQSIAAGWGGAQTVAGPELSIPFKQTVNTTEQVNGQPVTRTATIERRLILAPSGVDAATNLLPERRSRSIYDVVIYRAQTRGRALFQLPTDLTKLGVQPGSLALDRAELRFGISDARGLSGNPDIRVGGAKLALGPGGGTSLIGTGFYAPVDLTKVDPARLAVDFDFMLRGNGSLALAPRAGDTAWHVTSTWSNPSFGGGFLPDERKVGETGFDATYRIGNLSLGRSLLFVEGTEDSKVEAPNQGNEQLASIQLVEPVDLYSQVDRATKYGFLFVGFTFLAYLLFDIIGGVRVAFVEYALAGAGLVLFFVLLLAFAEVIGFTPAYLIAAAAITGLNTAYSAAVLKSWRRALVIGAILTGLYATLYVLLSLEAYSLLIGALLLFAALAGTMYVTRRLDWAGVRPA